MCGPGKSRRTTFRSTPTSIWVESGIAGRNSARRNTVSIFALCRLALTDPDQAEFETTTAPSRHVTAQRGRQGKHERSREIRRSGRTVADEAPERMVEELAARTLSGPALVVFCDLQAILAIATHAQSASQPATLRRHRLHREPVSLSCCRPRSCRSCFSLCPIRNERPATCPGTIGCLRLRRAVALLIWFAWQAQRILEQGWEYSAPHRKDCRVGDRSGF